MQPKDYISQYQKFTKISAVDIVEINVSRVCLFTSYTPWKKREVLHFINC